MLIEDIYKSEIIIVYIEQIDDLEKWKPFLVKLAEEEFFVTVNEERAVTGDEFMENESTTSIEIVCTVEDFIKIVPEIKKVDENGMVSIKRTYPELENYYYKEYVSKEDVGVEDNDDVDTE